MRGLASDPTFQSELAAARVRLLDDLRVELESQSGTTGEVTVHAEAETRYTGQTYTLPIHLGADDVTELPQRFHVAHEQAYGYRSAHDVEVVALRGTARRPPLLALHRARWHRVDGPSARPMIFDGVVHEVPLIERADVDERSIRGPAAVVQSDTTTVVPPGAVVRRLGEDLLEMNLENLQ
jgi:N-methylhydantoinase A